MVERSGWSLQRLGQTPTPGRQGEEKPGHARTHRPAQASAGHPVRQAHPRRRARRARARPRGRRPAPAGSGRQPTGPAGQTRRAPANREHETKHCGCLVSVSVHRCVKPACSAGHSHAACRLPCRDPAQPSPAGQASKAGSPPGGPPPAAAAAAPPRPSSPVGAAAAAPGRPTGRPPPGRRASGWRGPGRASKSPGPALRVRARVVGVERHGLVEMAAGSQEESKGAQGPQGQHSILAAGRQEAAGGRAPPLPR